CATCAAAARRRTRRASARSGPTSTSARRGSTSTPTSAATWTPSSTDASSSSARTWESARSSSTTAESPPCTRGSCPSCARRPHPHQRGGGGQRAHGGVLAGEDGRGLDVGLGVLLPRRHRAPLEGRALAADERGRLPVLGPLPPHGRDLGWTAHHALLPGLHA